MSQNPHLPWIVGTNPAPPPHLKWPILMVSHRKRRSEDELQVRLYDRNEAILSSAIDLSGSS
ncbi:unnamed protein product, partial [Amoebophrya sp. A120]|eukprot:GSA120T00016802001.1